MNNNEILLSVIIPAYNCEAYIENCVYALTHQNLDFYEVLIVDDGSTDRTPQICDSLASQNHFVHIYHKINEGQGIARNFALKHASGRYVTFVDADDLPTIGAYPKALALMEQKNYELGIFDWHIIEHNEKGPFFLEKSQSDIVKETKYDQVLSDMSSLHTQYGSGVWNKIYRTELIKKHDLAFQSERMVISEDYLFNYDILPYCEKILVSDIVLYNYRKNSESFSHKYQKEYFKRLHKFIAHIDSSPSFSVSERKTTATKKYSFVKTCIIQEVNFMPIHKAVIAISCMCKSHITRQLLKELDTKEFNILNRIAIYLIRYKLASLLYFFYKLKR